jgi:hypothetical protein
MPDNTRIFAAERSFDIGCRVIKWDEQEGLNFSSKNNFIRREITFDQLSNIIKQFTVHWSATYRAKDMFNGLNARNLSCNFMIDDDDINGFATIYQNLDCKHAGWSQGTGLNALGPGVEISYMPNAWEGDKYTFLARQKHNVPVHETGIGSVHGVKLKVHLPTKAQINSLIQLMWGFSELFPNVPPVFPRTAQGFPVLTKLTNPAEYTGFVTHYHLKREKVDIAGLDMEMLEKEVGVRKQTGY